MPILIFCTVVLLLYLGRKFFDRSYPFIPMQLTSDVHLVTSQLAMPHSKEGNFSTT